MADKTYDRSTQDTGNIVDIGHVNVCITDQHLATHYYVTGLGLTRDPFLNTGARLMLAGDGPAQQRPHLASLRVIQRLPRYRLLPGQDAGQQQVTR